MATLTEDPRDASTGTGGAERSSSGSGRVLLEPGATVIGRESARYEVVRSLGRGGMADIWLARRVSADGFSREVALKCVMPYLASDEGVRRMLIDEAKLAGRLRHPNIAEAHDLERIEDRYYLVLDYVDGVSVREVLEVARERDPSPSEGFCCHVAASVADALDYAHGLVDGNGRPLGIVHRDVKAANVMVARSGVVKLLDFGVAYSRLEGRQRTRTGQVKGTWEYFSPEQARGEASALDGRSDLFGLGILLVELLTGKRPFEAENELLTLGKIGACDALEVDAAIQGMSEGLRDVCRRALAKDPSDRFQTGGELAKALRTYLLERHVIYGLSECAAELGKLGLVTRPSIAAEGEERETPSSSEQPRPAWSGKSGWQVSLRADPAARGARPAGRSWAYGIAGVFLGAALATLGALAFHGAKSGADQVPPAASTLSLAPAPEPTAVHEEPQPSPTPETREPDSAPPLAVSSYDPLADLVVVRPKKAITKRNGPSKRIPHLDPEREVAENLSPSPPAAESKPLEPPRSTLPRGTLIHATLSKDIDAQVPGPAEALVAEDVMKGSRLLVPRGSGLLCNSRRAEAGRVGISCNGIKTTSAIFSFTGIGVGEGGNVGLRAVDGAVVSGTSFVVYVSAVAVF